jgi:hypothetical protein
LKSGLEKGNGPFVLADFVQIDMELGPKNQINPETFITVQKGCFGPILPGHREKGHIVRHFSAQK